MNKSPLFGLKVIMYIRQNYLFMNNDCQVYSSNNLKINQTKETFRVTLLSMLCQHCDICWIMPMFYNIL